MFYLFTHEKRVDDFDRVIVGTLEWGKMKKSAAKEEISYFCLLLKLNQSSKFLFA